MAMQKWHALSVEKVLEVLQTTKQGLSSEEAEKRLAKYGPNKIEDFRKKSMLVIFLEQFKSFLVAILIAAAIISLALDFFSGSTGEHTLDVILIISIVIANAVVGFLQEYKAEKSLEALKKLSAPKAKVFRDNELKIIDASLLVPGDIILLEQGDRVPADARLIEVSDFETNESMLTGESMPVQKSAAPLREATVLADRKNMVYMNTFVTRGMAKAVVVATAMQTEVGKIASMLVEAEEKTTPFQAELASLSKNIALILIVIIAIVAIVQAVLIKGSLIGIFMRAVSLAVAAVPEGLPAVVTIALALGVKEMAKRNALARKLAVAESLGSVNVICTDKTGTLTENKMKVRKGYANLELFDAKEIQKDRIELMLRCAALCNDASLSKRGSFGDPTEIALLEFVEEKGLNVAQLRSAFPRLKEIAFSSKRKMMSVVCSEKDKLYMFSKGAPEVIIEKCNKVYINGSIVSLSDDIKRQILKANKKMGSEALRVLAFAFKEIKTQSEVSEENLVFLGLLGMMDPPRAGVKEALEDCRNAGIKVIMLTGDNVETAKAIGNELGFKTDNAIDASELEKINEQKLREIVKEVEIFARVAPEHKVRILEALHANNMVVAMTGDGINDAPALKRADVGIAMGIRGTDVAKEASDLILLDDNFVTIRHAIAQGRAIFDNIRKFVNYLLSTNLAEVLVVFLFTLIELYIFFGKDVAILTASQLLWINLLTDGLPAVTLALDPASKDIMKRKPRPKSEGIINTRVMFSIITIGIVMSLFLLGVFLIDFFGSEGSIENRFLHARSMLFTAFVVFEFARVYMVRSRYKIGIFSNKWLIVAILLSLLLQAAIIYSPIAKLFKVVPLTLYDWLCLFGAFIAFFAFGIIETRVEDKIFKEG